MVNDLQTMVRGIWWKFKWCFRLTSSSSSWWNFHLVFAHCVKYIVADENAVNWIWMLAGKLDNCFFNSIFCLCWYYIGCLLFVCYSEVNYFTLLTGCLYVLTCILMNFDFFLFYGKWEVHNKFNCRYRGCATIRCTSIAAMRSISIARGGRIRQSSIVIHLLTTVVTLHTLDAKPQTNYVFAFRSEINTWRSLEYISMYGLIMLNDIC